MTDQFTPPTAPPVTPQPPAKKSKWYTSKWFIGVVVFAVGVGIGTASSVQAAEDLEVANGRIAGLEGNVQAARQKMSDLKSEVTASQGFVDAANVRADQAEVVARKTIEQEFQQKFADRDAKLDSRGAKLDSREAGLDATAATLDRREREVSGLERSWEANTIPGDGIFVVGPDIEPGLYKAEASSGCYYARLRSMGGGLNAIITNNNVDGPLAITVESTDAAVELSGCGEFHKVG